MSLQRDNQKLRIVNELLAAHCIAYSLKNHADKLSSDIADDTESSMQEMLATLRVLKHTLNVIENMTKNLSENGKNKKYAIAVSNVTYLSRESNALMPTALGRINDSCQFDNRDMAAAVLYAALEIECDLGATENLLEHARIVEISKESL